jgi:hypothetical protein
MIPVAMILVVAAVMAVGQEVIGNWAVKRRCTPNARSARPEKFPGVN